jgi:hypothetical protein
MPFLSRWVQTARHDASRRKRDICNNKFYSYGHLCMFMFWKNNSTKRTITSNSTIAINLYTNIKSDPYKSDGGNAGSIQFKPIIRSSLNHNHKYSYITVFILKKYFAFPTIYLFLYQYGPPLWSSGQSSWLQIRRPGFDSRHYQKQKLVGLERGALSLVSTTEELLDRKVAATVYKTENTAVGIRHADHVAPSIRKSWQSLRRQAAVARSV